MGILEDNFGKTHISRRWWAEHTHALLEGAAGFDDLNVEGFFRVMIPV